MPLWRCLSGWPSSCAGAISDELPNRSIIDLITPSSFTNVYYRTSEDRKRAVRTTVFTGLLEACMPLCRTPEERLFFQQAIFDQIVAFPERNKPNSSGKLMAECLERLRYEGNTHLLTAEEIPPILQGLNRRLRCKGNTHLRSQMGRASYNPQAGPTGKIYLPKVPNAESYLSNPQPAQSAREGET